MDILTQIFKDTHKRCIRALITESEKFSVRVLAKLIQRHESIALVGVATVETEVERYLKDSAVDVVLIDFALFNKSIFSLIEYIRKNYPRIKLIVYFDRDCNLNQIRSAAEHGVTGFLRIGADIDVIVEAIKQVALGGCYFDSWLKLALKDHSTVMTESGV